MKYCITGGSGFIGSYFCERLHADGHSISILDLIDPPKEVPHERFVSGDIRDTDACRAALEGCDRLVHLAAAHHDFGIADQTYFDVNERGTQVLCDVMDELNVREAAFYSTVALYGGGRPPFHEDATPDPQTPYGASKLAGENVLKQWTERGDGRRCLVIRPTVTFGRRNFANMYSLIRQIHGGKYMQFGKAENIKSLAYIENIMEATLFLMDKNDLPAFDVYNYVDTPDLTSAAIGDTIYEALGKKGGGVVLPYWFGRLLALPFDVMIALTGKNIPISGARVKKLFKTQTKFEAAKVRDAGFEARVPLKEGIRIMTAWYAAEGKDQSAEWHQPPAEAVVYSKA